MLAGERSRDEGRADPGGPGNLKVLGAGGDDAIGRHRGHGELGKVQPDGAHVGGVGRGQRVGARRSCRRHRAGVAHVLDVGAVLRKYFASCMSILIKKVLQIVIPSMLCCV